MIVDINGNQVEQESIETRLERIAHGQLMVMQAVQLLDAEAQAIITETGMSLDEFKDKIYELQKKIYGESIQGRVDQNDQMVPELLDSNSSREDTSGNTVGADSEKSE